MSLASVQKALADCAGMSLEEAYAIVATRQFVRAAVYEHEEVEALRAADASLAAGVERPPKSSHHSHAIPREADGRWRKTIWRKAHAQPRFGGQFFR